MLAIYCRVSKEEAAEEGISLTSQFSRGKELAKKLNLKYNHYEDGGFSGGLPVDKRPAFLSMVNGIRSKQITTVYVYNQSRLDRGDILQWAFIKNLFKKYKIELYYDGVFKDYTNINEEFSMDIQSLVNALYLKHGSKTIKENLIELIKQGKAPQGPVQAYGYAKDKDRNLIIDIKEAKIVKRIFKDAIEGKSIQKIAVQLNKENIKTKTGSLWTDGAVHRVITKSQYKGKLLYGKFDKKENIDERLLYDVPKIIEPEVFDKLQIDLKTRNTFKNTTNPESFLLKGLVYCDVCRRKYYVRTRTDRNENAYCCSSRQHYKNCGNKGINLKFLDKLVIDNINKLESIIETAFSNTELIERTKQYTKNSITLAKEIKEIEIGIDNLTDALMKSKIKNGVIIKKINELDFTLTAKKELKEDTDKELQLVKQKDSLIEFSRKNIIQLKKIKDTGEKTEFIRNIIRYVSIYWNEEKYTYDIIISFKINNLENYLMVKEILVNRSSVRYGKAVNKILDEDITIQNFIEVDGDCKIQFTIPTINFTNFISKHIFKPMWKK